MIITLQSLIEKFNLNIKGVIHLGAHLLEEKTDYDRFGVKNVVWVEGNPNLCEINRKTLEHSTNHAIYNYLISDQDDVEVDFKITNNGQSSSILDLDKHSLYYPHIVVVDVIRGKTKTVKSIIHDNAIDMSKFNFVNLDLQGVELKALKGFGELLNNIDYIYTEANIGSVYKNNDMLSDIDEYLKKFGFDRVETNIGSQEWGDAFYIKL